MTAPAITDETGRLLALLELGLLDTPSEPGFDCFTRLAASICAAPISTITLIDSHRQWFKSSIGLDIRETERSIAFCSWPVALNATMVIENALEDERFRHNPLVTGPPHLRFYAGVPLVRASGHAVGTLTVMDRVPRSLDESRLDQLKLLAEQVAAHIELGHQRTTLQQAVQSAERLNTRLARQTAHLREAQRIARVGSWELDLHSRQLLLSEETFHLFGMDARETPVEFPQFLSSVHHEDRAALQAAIDQALSGHASLDHAHRIVCPGGAVRHVHQCGRFTRGEHNELVFAGTVQDVTDLHHSHAELRLLHNCMARVNDIVMITESSPCDEPGPRIVFVNQAFEKHTGYRVDEAIGRSPRFLQGPHTQRAELDRIRHALEQHQRVSVEIINYRKDGGEFWVEIDIDPVIEEDEVTHFVAIQRDITQRKETARRIEQLAFYDPLTQLPNRRLLADRLQHAILSSARRNCCGALLYLDLDNFKSINDTLGHEQGDRLLKDVAQRLKRTLRASNTVARIGGDEFVVLLEDLNRNRLTAATEAELVAEKVLACLQEPFHIGGYEHHCTTSVGVVTFCGADRNGDELLKRADVAMYQAKGAGRNNVRFFDHSMQILVERRVALERELRGSLRRGEFVLHYQPQVNAAGELVGAEALVRWLHPARGLLYPAAFIDLAEETRLIQPLGQWVLESACRHLAELERESGSMAPQIAINVSAQQFYHRGFVDSTLGVFRAAGIDPHHIKLELSESALVEDFEDTAEKMYALKRHGVRFSLDDFGTGYSSLAYLKRLPVDEIKIDQAFVRDILVDPDDAAIVRTIIALCRLLDFKVVAEGVETEGQHAFLAELGCEVCQGNLFSPPRPAGEVFPRFNGYGGAGAHA